MPKLERRQANEDALHAAFNLGDLKATAELAIQCYGHEILGFLTARIRDRGQAEEAFSVFAEDLWRGLPNFAWRSTLRVWAYKLACNAASRVAGAPAARRQHNLPISAYASVLVAEAHSRRTPQYQRTHVKQRMAALRERLSEDDQALLMLHVDRGLRWRELALVLGSTEGAAAEAGPEAEAVLAREAVRLRKRFERLKGELRKLAVAEKLISAPVGSDLYS